MYSSQPSEIRTAVLSSLLPYPIAADSPLTQMEHDSGSVVPHHSIPSISKAIPPPATVPRKPELTSSNQRVVYPPKEACFKCVLIHIIRRTQSHPFIQFTYFIPKHSRSRDKIESGNTGPSYRRSCSILPLFRVG